MSLVNQMLRDLNARHASEVQATLHADVRTLPGRTEQPVHSYLRRNVIRVMGGSVLLALAVAGLAVGGWWWSHLPAVHEGVSSTVQQEDSHQSASASASAPAPVSPSSVEKLASSVPEVNSSSVASIDVAELRSTEANTHSHSLSAPVKERAEKAIPPSVTLPVAKSPEASRTGKPEKRHSSSVFHMDETLELASARVHGRMSALPDNGAQEKNAGRETNRGIMSSSISSTSSPPPVLAADERIVLTRKDKYGQDEKPEKIERAERGTEKNAGQAVIEKLDRSERGDDGYHEGVLAYQQGRLKDAVVQLQAVLRENPKHLQARQALLGIYMEYKRYDDAIILLQMGLDQMPGQANWAMTMARIQVERGNQAEALAVLEKYQVAGERNADYQGFIAVLLQNLRRSHEAVLRYKAALRLKPREGRWWFALGESLEADKRAAEATEAYRQAQSIGGLTAAMNDVLLTKLRR